MYFVTVGNNMATSVQLKTAERRIGKIKWGGGARKIQGQTHPDVSRHISFFRQTRHFFWFFL